MRCKDCCRNRGRDAKSAFLYTKQLRSNQMVTKRRTTALAATLAVTMVAGGAQDSKYTPVKQQIPAPACLTLRGAWEGGYTPCTAATHQEWLNDVTHWRMERRIRIGLDDARYL